MKLYLMRHGIAVDRIGGSIRTDADRPLTPAGQKETKLVASALKQVDVKPDLIVSSPLVRARQTAEILRDTFSPGPPHVISEALAPGGVLSDLFTGLREYPQASGIFFVGHEPDLGRLAGTLLWVGPDFDLRFKKAGVCCIDVFDLPPTHPGTLKWLLTPKLITAFMGCQNY